MSRADVVYQKIQDLSEAGAEFVGLQASPVDKDEAEVCWTFLLGKEFVGVKLITENRSMRSFAHLFSSLKPIEEATSRSHAIRFFES